MSNVRMSQIGGRLTARRLAAAALSAVPQASAYRCTLPAGWTSSSDGSDGNVATLTPASESAGTVQALQVAP